MQKPGPRFAYISFFFAFFGVFSSDLGFSIAIHNDPDSSFLKFFLSVGKRAPTEASGPLSATFPP